MEQFSVSVSDCVQKMYLPQENRLSNCAPSAPPLFPIGISYQYGVFPQ